MAFASSIDKNPVYVQTLLAQTAIDPDYALAHVSLDYIAMTGDSDPAGASRHYERAMALDPTDLRVLNSATVAPRTSVVSARRWFLRNDIVMILSARSPTRDQV